MYKMLPISFHDVAKIVGPSSFYPSSPHHILRAAIDCKILCPSFFYSKPIITHDNGPTQMSRCRTPNPLCSYNF